MYAMQASRKLYLWFRRLFISQQPPLPMRPGSPDSLAQHGPALLASCHPHRCKLSFYAHLPFLCLCLQVNELLAQVQIDHAAVRTMVDQLVHQLSKALASMTAQPVRLGVFALQARTVADLSMRNLLTLALWPKARCASHAHK